MYFMSGISDDQILRQSFSTTDARGSQLVRDTALQAAHGGALWLKPGSPDCTNVGSGTTSAKLVSSSGGISMQLASVAPATGPLAPILLGAGAVLSVFGSIFGAHKAAQAREANILCSAVPAANDAIRAINDAVNNGTITANQGAQSLDKLYSDLTTTVQPILKANSDQCNAACFVLAEARALIVKLKSDYLGALAPGSWNQTCRNASVANGQLTAECERMDGGWQFSSIATNCTGIENINGTLKCTGSLIPLPAAPSPIDSLVSLFTGSSPSGSPVMQASTSTPAAATPSVPWWIWAAGAFVGAKIFGVI